MRCIFTAHDEVIFSQVSAILSTEGGVPGPGGMERGSGPRGVPLLRGCLVPGRGPGPGGGGVLLREVVPGLGGCLVETPGTATTAGGMHPTGIHASVICQIP